MVGAIVIATLWNLFFPQAKRWTPVFSLVGLLFAGVTLSQQFMLSPVALFGGLYTVDKLTVSFGLLAAGVGIIVVLMSMGFESELGTNRGEFYALLLSALLSVMLLAGTTDLILLFVGLETLSICCVLLAGLVKKDRASNEAALKYLLSTAAVTATLLYALSFVYGLTSSTNYGDIHMRISSLVEVPSLLIIFILVLLMSAIGFKLSIVPFHMWTPDVYQGAPTPVTAFMSVATKAAVFPAFLRVFNLSLGSVQSKWFGIIWALAIATMIVGNVLALSQSNMKRLLAYS